MQVLPIQVAAVATDPGAFPKIRGIPTGSQPMPPEAPASWSNVDFPPDI